MFSRKGERARGKTILALLVLMLIAVAVYWPVIYGRFVWDDHNFFLGSGWWIYQEDLWKQKIFEAFPEARNYFRPMVLGLLTLEGRSFGLFPVKYHAVSLLLHAAITGIVYLLALSYSRKAEGQSVVAASVAAACYAIHPALVESIAWISGQFDLDVTLFCLLALLFDQRLQHRGARACAVGLSFLAAAGCKEAAAPFPLLLFIVHWTQSAAAPSLWRNLVAVIKENWATYLGVAMGGLVYLVVRYASLHYILTDAVAVGNAHPNLLQRVGQFSYTYIAYWKTLLLPFSGLGPLHEATMSELAFTSPLQWMKLLLSVTLIAFGVVLWLRKSWLGTLIVMFTAALFPVLHVLKMTIGENLYQLRFLTLPLAVFFACLPAAIATMTTTFDQMSRLSRYVGLLVVLLWATACVANVRVTIPLWGTNLSLWAWAVQEEPNSLTGNAGLLDAYVQKGRYGDALPVANKLLHMEKYLFSTLIQCVGIFIHENDMAGAKAVLDFLAPRLTGISNSNVAGFYWARGLYHQKLRDLPAAEQDYRRAIEVEPNVAQYHATLSDLLAELGRAAEADAEKKKVALYLGPGAHLPESYLAPSDTGSDLHR